MSGLQTRTARLMLRRCAILCSATACVLWEAAPLRAQPEGVDFGFRKPSALRAAEAARMRIEKADITWTRTNFFDRFAPGVPFGYRSVLTRGETALFLDGTPEGIASWHESGRPMPDSRRADLLTENQRWRFERDLDFGYLWEQEQVDREISDIRVAGLLPLPALMTTVPEAVARFGPDLPSARKYRERVMADGIYEVDMWIPEAETIIRWHIDPEKDWNPVRSQFIYRDEVINECVVEYETHSGVWFPRTVAYPNAAGDVVTLLEVQDVRIDPPDIPDKLTPDIIGFATGMYVAVQSGPLLEKQKEDTFTYVSGGTLIPGREFLTLRAEGRLREDPGFEERARQRREAALARRAAAEKAAAAGSAPQPASQSPSQPASQSASRPAIVPNRVDDEWEKYTREFIERHRLDKDQSASAWRILRSCQEQRTRYLRSRRDRMDALEVQLRNRKSTEDGERLLRELAEIRKPVERIFEEQLKPRLDALLTRRQREQAHADSSKEP